MVKEKQGRMNSKGTDVLRLPKNEEECVKKKVEKRIDKKSVNKDESTLESGPFITVIDIKIIFYLKIVTI